MFKKVTAVVEKNEQIAQGIYKLALLCEDADLVHFVPGQFANIAIPGHAELLLKRPVSIHAVEGQTAAFIYQVVGKGTAALSLAVPGARLDTIMPVGRGFHLKRAEQKIWLVGGGMGIAPLLTVAKKWADKSYEAFLGYAGNETAYCIEDFAAVCEKVHVSSNDGTIGEKGYVTELVEKRLEAGAPDAVIGCGPVPMLRALKALITPLDIAAQVSLDQRMCCGFGACATCVCGVDTGDGLDYKKVCIEGPVFDINEVVL